MDNVCLCEAPRIKAKFRRTWECTICGKPEQPRDTEALAKPASSPAGGDVDGDIGHEETYLLNLLEDDRLTGEDLHRAFNRIRHRQFNRTSHAAAVTTAMVNAAWSEAKTRRMSGLPTDFRAVLEAALSQSTSAGRGE